MVNYVHVVPNYEKRFFFITDLFVYCFSIFFFSCDYFLCVPKVFQGNSDQNSIVCHDIPSSGSNIEARHIRVLPQEFRANMCMRIELYECVGKS